MGSRFGGGTSRRVVAKTGQRDTPCYIALCSAIKAGGNKEERSEPAAGYGMGAGGSGFIFILVISALGLVCYCFTFSLSFLLLSLGHDLHCLKDLLLLLIVTFALVLNHNSFWVQWCRDILGPLMLILPDPSYAGGSIHVS